MVTRKRHSEPEQFLSSAGPGREMKFFRKGKTIFRQGEIAHAIFVVQGGMVALRGTESQGRAATISILQTNDLFGEDCMGIAAVWTVSAEAVTDCTALRIRRTILTRELKRSGTISIKFWRLVLARNVHYQQNLIDQLCNGSENRLARILLSISHLAEQPSTEVIMPNLHHAVLAEMVGTTRSRITFFMNRFRDAGFIEYSKPSESLLVRRSLLAFSNI